MKHFEMYLSVVLFIILYEEVSNYKSIDRILYSLTVQMKETDRCSLHATP